jgi:hypothetical protein
MSKIWNAECWQH